MTETGGALPEGRYGTARGAAPRRHWRWVFVAFGLAAGIAIAYIAYLNLGSAPISAQRIAFAEQPGNSMEITVRISRDDPGLPAVCIVRVRDISGVETGRKEIFVPPSKGDIRLHAVIRSGTRPVTADVFGCSYDVPEYLSRP